MDPHHVKILQQGVDAWNIWREQDREKKHPVRPDLNSLRLRGAKFGGANLQLTHLNFAHLSRADLSKADLLAAGLMKTDLRGANLAGARLRNAVLLGARLNGANLSGADLSIASIGFANLTGANLSGANLSGARLTGARLHGADLKGANLSNANLVDADLTGADLTGCRVYGVSVWRLKLDEHTKQQNLVITPRPTASRGAEPEVTVDNIEVAQFVYLLLHNEKIREAIDTIGKKGVLLLGRFTGGRLAVLEKLREELRKRGFLPIVFKFDKPETKDFTETVRLLAGMSRFVIADITNPRSAPLELQATVPEYMIPFVPILERGEEPFAMFRDLWIKHRQWVLNPIRYSSVDRLIEVLDTKIIKPAQVRFAKLQALKAEEVQIEDV
jgi:hypothetical protein